MFQKFCTIATDDTEMCHFVFIVHLATLSQLYMLCSVELESYYELRIEKDVEKRGPSVF
jgi:hypothetical protein